MTTTLIAEDLLLLLLDDERGTAPALWVDLRIALAGAVLAEKPRSASDLLHRIAKGLEPQLGDRLVAAGVLERHDERVLGLFPRTRWPALQTERESALRDRIRQVLIDGAEPDPRTAALIAVLAAVERVPATLGLRGTEGRAAASLAAALGEGDWAAGAVREAVRATIVAVTTASVTGVVVATGAN